MNLSRVSVRSQKALLIIALVSSTIYGFSYVVLLDFFPPPPATLSIEEIVALYSRDNLEFRAGVALMMIFGGFFALFSAVLGVQMARDELSSPLWAILQLITAPFQGLLFVIPALLWGIAAFTVQRPPEVTVLAHEAAWLTFVTPVGWYPFMLASVAVVCFAKKKDEYTTAFPRWLGWLTLVPITGAEFGFAAELFKTGPLAWNGLFPFYLPTFTFLLWFAAINFCLFRALNRQALASAKLPAR